MAGVESMNFARIAVLAVALVAGGIAAYMVSSGGGKPAPAPVVVQKSDSDQVLAAATDIGMGSVITAADLKWTDWPKSSAGSFITRSAQPDALNDTTGAIARQPFIAGEPIREQKIVKANGSGFLSAILPAGMRAIATEISAENGAGGFILPNDRVDVILTSRAEKGGSGSDQLSSQTILTNVRVLAINQNTADKDGQKAIIGTTATLALLPRQAEDLALARQKGTISLVLRSLADSQPGAGPENGGGQGSGGLNVVRFGVSRQAEQ